MRSDSTDTESSDAADGNQCPLKQNGRGLAGKKFAHRQGDWFGVRFQREVPCIEKVNLRARNVPLEGVCPRRQEERIMLTPHRQERRFVRAEVILECRIQ